MKFSKVKFPLLQKVALVMLFFLNLVDILMIVNYQYFEANPVVIQSWNTIGFIPSCMLKMSLVFIAGIVSYLILKVAEPNQVKPLTIISNVAFFGYVTYYSALLGWNLGNWTFAFGV